MEVWLTLALAKENYSTNLRPIVGQIVWVEDEGKCYVYDGTDWNEQPVDE